MNDHFKNTLRQAVTILFISLLLGMGVNSFSRNGINPFRHPVASATTITAIRQVSLEEAQQIVGSGIPILDARPKEDFTEGHITGAISLPYYDMGSYLDQTLPFFSTSQLIMIYCSEASCADAELLARKISALGYTRLLVFKGGFKAWTVAGLPIESEAP
jgi:rhodanese-related sulfurtransferase